MARSVYYYHLKRLEEQDKYAVEKEEIKSISHNISNSPNLEQVDDMLDKAFGKCDNLDGLVLHSDQGWQYFGYRKRLEEHHITQSMSRKGNCLDNSMMENFFGIMKSELLYTEKFESPEDFTKALEEIIIIKESSPG